MNSSQLSKTYISLSPISHVKVVLLVRAFYGRLNPQAFNKVRLHSWSALPNLTLMFGLLWCRVHFLI
nr:MAG TPA: hypothetical protein [Caudoviricetes sp.]